MDLADVATHFASATFGGVTVGGIVRFLVQRWVAKNDESHQRWGDLITELKVTMAEVKVWVSSYQQGEQARRDKDEQVAVLTSRVGKLETDVNALGQKLRDIEQNRCCEVAS